MTASSLQPLSVRPVALGTSSWRQAEGETHVDELLDEVFRSAGDGGLPVFVDTSNAYAQGLSEKLIGDAVRRWGGLPENVVLQTKLDRDFGTGDFSADRMRRSLDESLGRLGVESVDILHIHDPENISYDEAFASDGPVAELLAMQSEGRAARIGISGGPAPMLERYVETGLFQSLITHNRFTIVDRSAEVVLTRAHEAGLFTLNAAPYGGGGGLAKWPAPIATYGYRPAPAALADAADAMGTIADAFGVPLGAVALQWSTRSPIVDTTVVGANRLGQWTDALALDSVTIPDSVWAEVAALAPDPSTWLEPTDAPSVWNDFPTALAAALR